MTTSLSLGRSGPDEGAVIVFSGYNHRAVVACLRELTRYTVPFGIVATPGDPILDTPYADSVVVQRGSTDLDEDQIVGLISEFVDVMPAASYLVMPTSEYLVRVALRARPRLRRLRVELPTVDETTYALLSDKELFGRFLRRHALPFPATLDRSIVRAPAVAKPRSYDTAPSLRPVLVLTDEELAAFPDALEPLYYWQEFVSGPSYYLLYHVSRQGRILRCAQQNLLQQPGGASILGAVLSDYAPQPLTDRLESALRGLDFHGLLMVEVMDTPTGPMIIEANPRMWGPSQLYVDAGVPLLAHLWADYGLMPPPGPPESRAHDVVRYFWEDGLPADHGLIKYHPPYSRDRFEADLTDWRASDVLHRADLRRHATAAHQPLAPLKESA